jgi:hypothetical protein
MSKLQVFALIVGMLIAGAALAGADMWLGVYLDAHPRIAVLVLLGFVVAFMGLFVLALTTRPSVGHIQGDQDA